MEVPSKNSLLSDMGRRPQLKSDEFFEGTPLCSRDNRTFVFETAQESGSVIGGATPLEELHIDVQAALSLYQGHSAIFRILQQKVGWKPCP